MNSPAGRIRADGQDLNRGEIWLYTVNLDHVQTVEKGRLRRLLGTVAPEKMSAVCRALAIAAGCGP